jgi:hypothetical protein
LIQPVKSLSSDRRTFERRTIDATEPKAENSFSAFALKSPYSVRGLGSRLAGTCGSLQSNTALLDRNTTLEPAPASRRASALGAKN